MIIRWRRTIRIRQVAGRIPNIQKKQNDVNSAASRDRHLMLVQLFLLLILSLSASVAALAQDRCLRITRIPPPEKPAEKTIAGDQIWNKLRIEFKSDGSLGTIHPLASGLDRKVDTLVMDAARRIEFVPKRVGYQTVPVKRDIDYGYSFSKSEWTMTPGAGQCLTQTNLLDDSEENRLRATAREFIMAWTDSHDLRPLEDRYFLPGYTAVIDSPDMSPIGEGLFDQLTDGERRNTFMSFWNYAYLGLVLMQSKPRALECWDESSECVAKRRESMQRVLNAATVDAILAREKDQKDPKDKAEFLAYIAFFGDVFEKALPTLKKQDLEETAEFKNSMDLLEDDHSLDYFIKSGVADKDYRDNSGRVVIAKGEKLLGVETPLILRIDFVQRGNTFKVFNIGAGDGD